MDKLLDLFVELWPDFWPLMIAPPIYAIWLKFLSGPNWTDRIRGWLHNEVWSGAYTAILGLLSARLDALFGPKWLGARAFGMCFFIAIFYAVFWLFASLALQMNDPADRTIAAIGLALALPIGGVTYWLSRLTRRRHDVARASRPDRQRWLMIREYLCYFCIGAIAGAVAGAVAIAGAGAGAVAVAVAGAVAIAVAGAGAGAVAVAVAGAVAVAVAVAVAGAVAGAGAGAVAGAGAGAGAGAAAAAGAAAVAVILFLFFPFVNAVFDWPSWAASRWLVARLGQDAATPILWRRWALLAGHVLLDLALALLALLGLAICLAMIFSAGDGQWRSLYDDPFSLEGSTLSVMLLSTLVPTAIHLFCAVLAILPALPIGHRKVVTFMPFKRNFEEFEAGDRMIVAVWLTFWSVMSVVAVWLMFKGGIWLLDLMWSADLQERNFWQVLLDTARGIQQWLGIDLQ